MQEFDRARLQPFYRRVTRAIREVDPEHILFFEFVVEQFDTLGCGDTYWDYQPALANSPIVAAFRRSPAIFR